MSGLARRAPLLLFGLALIASSALLLVLDSDLTFFQDSWAFLMHRQGSSLDDFLAPHNEHIVVIPVILQKLLLEVFGMGSSMPEFVLLTLTLVVTAVLLFVYVRRRLGDWPALFAATLVLFLGPASQVLLWPFEIALVGSTMTGVAMLLALEREDRAGDLVACLLLVLSIGFSSLGLAFAVGAGVDVLQRRRSRGLGRLFVPAAPVALYGIWYLGWGNEAQSNFALASLPHVPTYVAEGLAASLAALTGLSALTDSVDQRPWAGLALLALLLVLLGWWLWTRRPGIPARFWPAAASATTFWVLGALNQGAGREAEASRYLHFGAVLVLMMAADLLKGARFGRWTLAAAAAIVVAICAVNLRPLHEGHDYFREQTVLTRADLAAMEIAERTISPYFSLLPEVAGTPSLIDVSALEYFPVEHAHGSPAYTPAELAAAPEAGRVQADVVLSQALPLSTEVEAGAVLRPLRRCVTVVPGSPRLVPVGPGLTRIGVAPGPRAEFSLRRFARRGFPVPTPGAPGGSVTKLRVPADRSDRPWLLRVEASQPVLVCPAVP